MRLAASLLLAATAAATLHAAEPNAAPDGRAALERIKALAGDWEGTVTTPDGPKVSVVYRVTSSGSAVLEDLFPGTDHEMITMYHLDGDALVLTHYCAMGNQPKMRLAEATPAGLRFDFAGGSNLDPAKDPHMHAGRLAFPAADRIEAEWAVYEGGKQTGSNRFYLSRKGSGK
jgi:hypothetical protein